MHVLLLLLLSHFSRVRLCDPIDGSPPGSVVPGILQARTLEWVMHMLASHKKRKPTGVRYQFFGTRLDEVKWPA